MTNADSNLPLPPAHRRKFSLRDLPTIKLVRECLGQTSDTILSSRTDDWCEKIVKFVQTYRNRLGKVMRQRFGGEAIGATLLDILVKRAWPEEWERNGLGTPDLRALNAALWLDKAQSGDDRLERILGQLPNRLAERKGSWRPDAEPIPNLSLDDNSQAARSSLPDSPISTIVLCPNHRSANTLSTLHWLQQLEIPVEHIFVRPLVSVSRLKEELGFSPAFLVKRVINELIMPRFRSGSKDHANLSGYKRQIGCRWKNVAEAASELGARVHYFANFNHAQCVKQLSAIQPNYGIFTGGGILNADMLNTFQTGIVHAHPGVLPQYKGMDVVQWAILEGNYEHIGSTCQLMSPKLDAGVLLSNSLVDIREHATLQSLRTQVVADKIGLVCKTLRSVIDGNLDTDKAPPQGGKLYYLMHPRLGDLSADFAKNQMT